MYCKHCGKEIESQSNYCPHCGRAQNDVLNIESPVLNKFFSSKVCHLFKLISIPVIGLIMLACAIAGLILEPKSTWLIIACISFIFIGCACIIRFIVELVKRNKKQ